MTTRVASNVIVIAALAIESDEAINFKFISKLLNSKSINFHAGLPMQLSFIDTHWKYLWDQYT